MKDRRELFTERSALKNRKELNKMQQSVRLDSPGASAAIFVAPLSEADDAPAMAASSEPPLSKRFQKLLAARTERQLPASRKPKNSEEMH